MEDLSAPSAQEEEEEEKSEEGTGPKKSKLEPQEDDGEKPGGTEGEEEGEGEEEAPEDIPLAKSKKEAMEKLRDESEQVQRSE